MKRILFSIVFLAACLVTQAQQISVASFRLAENDLTAMTHGTEVKDQNGNTCALIKVETTQTGFTFDVGVMGVMKTEQHTGEIWVYVPFGVKRITIQHQQLGTLRDYYFPCGIEKGRTYIMQLITGKVSTVVTEVVQQQFLVINVVPKNSMVTLNGEVMPVKDGMVQKFVDFGTYDYRVDARDYHSEVGKVTVNDPNGRTELNVVLKPAFGWMSVSMADAEPAMVYVDNEYVGQTPLTHYQLGSGKHNVKVVREMYKPFERTVVVEDGETVEVVPAMNADFAEASLTVNESPEAEIWLNGEKIGVGTWQGRLSVGNYQVECRQAYHKPVSQVIAVRSTEPVSFTLNAPQPVYGRLKVMSEPANAEVLLDGEKVGATPLFLSQVLAGPHVMVVTKTGFLDETRNLMVVEEKTEDIEIVLSDAVAVTIGTTDKEITAKVYVDGEYVGVTPYKGRLSAASHNVRLSCEGYDDLVEEVSVGTENANFFFPMQEKTITIRVKANRNGTLKIDDVAKGSVRHDGWEYFKTTPGPHQFVVESLSGNAKKLAWVRNDYDGVELKIREKYEEHYYISLDYCPGTGWQGFGMDVGGYIGNRFNFELEEFLTFDYSFDFEDALDIGFDIKLGWAIDVANRFRITPQIGAAWFGDDGETVVVALRTSFFGGEVNHDISVLDPSYVFSITPTYFIEQGVFAVKFAIGFGQ